MMSQQRPATSAGKSSKALATSTLAPSSASSPTIPQCITSNTLSSLVRLPIDSNCTVKWDRYNFESIEDQKGADAVCEALMEVTKAECESTQSIHNSNKLSMLSLNSNTLWATERKSRDDSYNDNQLEDLVGVWIFDMGEPSGPAESSTAAVSQARRHLDKCKDEVKQRLTGIKKTSGKCQMSDFYLSSTPLAVDDLASLLPIASQSEIHRHLIKAIEEWFLSKWVWTDFQASTAHREEAPLPALKAAAATAKQRASEDEDKDEEEEGAIEDQSTLSSLHPSKFWNTSQRWKKGDIIRFASGIIHQPPPSSSRLFDLKSQRDQKCLCFTLRCFVNDQGHVYLETRPLAASKMEHIDDCKVENRRAILGPIGFQASLVERVPALKWPYEEEEGEGDDSKSKREMLQCKNSLLKKLEVRGVHVDRLGDDWMVCETDDKKKFLWPSVLCYVLPINEETKPVVAHNKNLRLANKPLRDVALRARGLVKEVIGYRGAGDDEDTKMLDMDDMEGREASNEEGEEEDESPDDDEDDIDAPDDDGKGAADGQVEQVSVAGTAQVSTSGGNTIENVASTALPRTMMPEDDKLNNVIRTDDEPDLWGTFGFGPQDDDEVGKEMRRQSGAGLDDGAFGLITEDDFSFFDGGAFDEMDQDSVLQEHNDVGGDTTIQAMDNDYSSEVATTNSTFIDPPSLPGFTPSSLSATSPAVGLNAKTPRTPYSPNQDLLDANVSIEGETDSMFHDSRRFHHHRSSEVALTSMPTSHLDSHDPRSNRSGSEKLPWSRQNRGDLTSKYEQGKFALPLVPTRKRGEGEDGSEEGASERDSSIHLRSRLGHRSHSGRRMSGVKSLHLHSGPSRKLIRTEEEMSDLEATVDGTISERSSLMDEDSDDDLSSTSEDASEGEESVFKLRLEWLQSSAEQLHSRTMSKSKVDLLPLATESEKFDSLKEAQVVKQLTSLTNNPHARNLVLSSEKTPKDVIPRSSTLNLFAFLLASIDQASLATLLDIPSPDLQGELVKAIQVLEPPKITIGCQETIATMESTALPFWESLGLCSVSGPKGIVAFALHCSNLPDIWHKELSNWFTTLDYTFQKAGLGKHELAEDGLLAIGSSQMLSIAYTLAIMALHAEQWTDTLESLMSRLEVHLKEDKFVVIYAFDNSSQPGLFWTFLKLESDLRDLAKKRWNIAPDLINVRAYPWTVISSSISAVHDPACGIRRLATSIYDSLLVPIRANHNRKVHLPVLQSESVGIVYPSFTLTPSSHYSNQPTGRFQLKWKIDPFNVVDTGLLLHVAYHLGKNKGDLSFVAIMDEKAQGHFVTGWRRGESLQGEVEQVWKQVQEYSRRARVLWRIVICSDSQMQLEEVQQWSLIVKQQLSSLRALDVTLACFDAFTPMSLILARPFHSDAAVSKAANASQKPVKAVEDKFMHYIDARQADFAIYPPFRVAMCSGADTDQLLPLQSSVTVSISNQYNGGVAVTPHSRNDDDSDNTPCSATAPRHYWLHILQVYRSSSQYHHDDYTLRNRIELITKSFHQLTFIARERFMLEDNLPWHLAILSTFCHAS